MQQKLIAVYGGNEMRGLFHSLQHYYKQCGPRKKYWIVYTLAFALTSFFVFSWFLFSGKSLIWISDGWSQHYKALLYYSGYLKSIIKHLWFEHRLVIPDWDFYIGEGSDIVNALHYYAIGDPFALFSVLVPAKYMPYYYSFAAVLRLYCAGIAFSALAFGTGCTNRYGILAGALSYCFSFWGIFNVARHPYFLNPMIWFPMMILGIEKIIRGERPYLFVVTTALAAASNFYFFYMFVILSVLYAVIRLGLLYGKDMMQGVKKLLYMAVHAVIGVSIAGIILLPVLMMFLQDSRLGNPQPFHLFYPLYYYSKLPAIILSSEESFWLCLGITVPAVLAIILMWIRRNESRLLKILLGVCAVFILFPICGRFLNGMSYASNRWCWALVLLCSYILSREWDHLMQLSQREYRILFLSAVVIVAVCMLLDESCRASVLSVLPLLFICLSLITDNNLSDLRRHRQALIVLIVMINVITTAFWKYSVKGSNYAADFKDYSRIETDMSNNEARIIREIADDDYPRFTGRNLTYNVSMFNQVSSTQYYWTISNPYMNQYRTDLGMREAYFHNFHDYDDRTVPIELAAVQYYVTEETTPAGIPFGYKMIDAYRSQEEEIEKQKELLKQELGVTELSKEQEEWIEGKFPRTYRVFRNKFALPLGYCYDARISGDTWNDLDMIQKQEIQLDAVYLEDDVSDLPEYSGDIKDYEVPYRTAHGIYTCETESGFVTTEDNLTLKLTVNAPKQRETYLVIEGLDFHSSDALDLYHGGTDTDPKEIYNETNWNMYPSDRRQTMIRNSVFKGYTEDIDFKVESSSGVSKTFNYKSPDASFSSGRHDYVINLGYLKTPLEWIKLTFPKHGIYTIRSLKVCCVPMADYEKRVSRRKETVLENIELGKDRIRGTVETDQTKFLVMAIPYSEGWKAYVDGSETKVYRANERYLGIMITPGKHNVVFRYEMPFKREGSILSAAGILVFVCVVIINETLRRRHKKQSD